MVPAVNLVLVLNRGGCTYSYDFRIVYTTGAGNIADSLSCLLRNRNEVSNHKRGAQEYVLGS